VKGGGGEEVSPPGFEGRMKGEEAVAAAAGAAANTTAGESRERVAGWLPAYVAKRKTSKLWLSTRRKREGEEDGLAFRLPPHIL